MRRRDFLIGASALATYGRLAEANATTSAQKLLLLEGGRSQSSGPTIYLGQVATRSYLPQFSLVNAQQLMSRSAHIARDSITSLQIVTLGENTSTETASIEYPAGTFTQVKFSGSAQGTYSASGSLVSDVCSVAIPKGTTFWVRLYHIAPTTTGLVTVVKNLGVGDALNFGNSGISDQTLGGTITDAGGSGCRYPSAIIANTALVSVFCVGDSRCMGTGDNAPDNGELAPSIGPSFAYINAGIAGDKAQNWATNHPTSVFLMQYCSHVITSFGINDLAAGTAATVLAGYIQSIRNLVPLKPFFVTTVSPFTTSSDSWITVANQTITASNAQHVAYNQSVRAGFIWASGTFDICSALESGQDTGKWGAPATTATNASPTIGDTIQLTFTSSAITGSPININYTVPASPTTFSVVTALAALINANANLVAAGIQATGGVSPASAVLSITQPSALSPQAVVTKSTTGTGTITLGTQAITGDGLHEDDAGYGLIMSTGKIPASSFHVLSTTPIINENFVTGSYFPRPITSELIDTRSTVKYVQDASINLNQIAINGLPISNTGLLYEPAATNLFNQPSDLGNVAWSNSTSGSGTVSATSNQGTAPDGTSTAAKLVFQRTNTTSGAVRFQSFTGTVANYTGKFYVKAFGAGDVGAAVGAQLFNGTVVVGTQLITLTAAWQPVVFTGLAAVSASCNFNIGLQANVGTQTGTVNVLVANASNYLGADSSWYPGARAADSIQIQRTGIGRIVLTFSDLTQQTLDGINPASMYTIPTGINETLITKMVGYSQ